MQIKSITTVAGVNEIDFGNDDSQTTAHFYWFKNLSDSTLYVSAKPNPVAGEDNVAELSAKGAVSVETDEGKVYVLGAGKVEIHRTNSKFCPFELPSTGSGGGGGGSITVDSELSETSINPLQNKATTKAINEVKTELSGKSNTGHTHLTSEITDFPDALPANGGNADTVGGKSANDFIRRYGSTMLSAEYVSAAAMDTDYKGIIDSAVANNIGLDGSNSCWWHIIGLKNFNDDGYGTQIAIPLLPSTPLQTPKYRTSAGTVFQSWQNFADGGNADKTNAIVDYAEANRITKIGWTGESLTPSQVHSFPAFTELIGNEAKIKDISIENVKKVLGIQSDVTLSDVNDAPYGVSYAPRASDCVNAPFDFWSTILTLGGTANTAYRQQIAFPWDTENSKIMPKYRVMDSGVWKDWRTCGDIKPYITGTASKINNAGVVTSGYFNTYHGFIPSAVFYFHPVDHTVFTADGFDANGFYSNKDIRLGNGSEATELDYIIFK